MVEPTQTFQANQKSDASKGNDAFTEAGRNAGKKALNATADVARTHIDTAQESFNSGAAIAADAAHRSVSGLQEALSSDKATEAAKLSSQHLEAMAETTAALSQGFQEVSREWLSWAQRSAEKSQQGFAALMQCRTPHELVEAQSRLLRDGLEDLVASAQKISEVSTDVSKKASQKITKQARP